MKMPYLIKNPYPWPIFSHALGVHVPAGSVVETDDQAAAEAATATGVLLPATAEELAELLAAQA